MRINALTCKHLEQDVTFEAAQDAAQLHACANATRWLQTQPKRRMARNNMGSLAYQRAVRHIRRVVYIRQDACQYLHTSTLVTYNSCNLSLTVVSVCYQLSKHQ